MRFPSFIPLLLFLATSLYAAEPAAIVIPSLSLKNVQIEDALIQVAKLSRTADPQGQGISVVICSLKVASGLPVNSKTITMDAQNISIISAIQKITSAGAWWYSVKGDTIYAWNYTPCPPDQIGFGVFEISPSKLPTDFLPDPRKYFEKQGVQFSARESVKYKKDSGLLIVRATEETLDFVRALIEYLHGKDK